MLPASAADAHMEEHPLDTEGPCEGSVVVIEKEETSMAIMEPKPTKKKR